MINGFAWRGGIRRDRQTVGAHGGQGKAAHRGGMSVGKEDCLGWVSMWVSKAKGKE